MHQNATERRFIMNFDMCLIKTIALLDPSYFILIQTQIPMNQKE